MLSYTTFDLKLKKPFVIATGKRISTSVVLVKWHSEGVTGIGEASLPPYLKDDQNSTTKFLDQLDMRTINDPDTIYNDITESVKYAGKGHCPAKAAVEMALLDWAGKMKGINISELLNFKNRSFSPTSLTVSIGEPEAVMESIRHNPEFKIFKIKLGSAFDEATIRRLRTLEKPFCLDINQGWKDTGMAHEMIRILENSRCEYIEQPFPVQWERESLWLKDRTRIPVIADEAFQTLEDMDRVGSYYDGINIKLMKCGGILAASKIIKEAKQKGMKVVLGSMTETSCALTAASYLSPLADWADLDSQFLTANDPFEGMRVINGIIHPPIEKPGLGVKCLK